MSNDDAVRECEKHIREARAEVVLALQALAGVEDARERNELEYRIINVGALNRKPWRDE